MWTLVGDLALKFMGHRPHQLNENRIIWAEGSLPVQDKRRGRKSNWLRCGQENWLLAIFSSTIPDLAQNSFLSSYQAFMQFWA